MWGEEKVKGEEKEILKEQDLKQVLLVVEVEVVSRLFQDLRMLQGTWMISTSHHQVLIRLHNCLSMSMTVMANLNQLQLLLMQHCPVMMNLQD